MGFIDWLKGLFGGGKPSEDDHFFADDKTQKANAKTAAESLAPQISGTIKTRDDGDELHITGTHRGRPVRIKLDITFGGAEFETKIRGKRVEDGVMLLLMHDDKGADNHAKSRQNRDQWDKEDDGGEERIYVSQNHYYEVDPDERAAAQALWARLSTSLQQQLTAQAQREQATVVIKADSVEFKPWKGFLGLPDINARAMQLLDLEAAIGDALE